MSEVPIEEAVDSAAVEQAAPREKRTIAVRLTMREEIRLTISPRPELGKGPVGRLRREQAQLPGVLYGHNQAPTSFKVVARAMRRLLSKGAQNAIFLVEQEGSDGEPQRAIVRAVQYHKVRGEALHIDLLRIDSDEILTVSVPLLTQGIPQGVREGGALQQSMAAVDMECIASELPSSLEIDVSDLEVGESVHVSDLLEQESRIVTDPHRSVCTVLAPRIVEEEVVEEEEAVLEEGEVAEGDEATPAEEVDEAGGGESA